MPLLTRLGLIKSVGAAFAGTLGDSSAKHLLWLAFKLPNTKQCLWANNISVVGMHAVGLVLSYGDIRS